VPGDETLAAKAK